MSLAVLADHMASKGRGPDSMLIHMSPREVQGLQALAENHGGSLTINPETGLPEAGFLDKLLPTIIGFALNTFVPGLGTAVGGALGTSAAVGTGLAVGGFEALRTGDLGRGISAGLGAYGGASLGANLAAAGTGAISSEVGSEALKAAGLTGEAALTAEADQIVQKAVGEKLAASTPFESLSAGADVVKNDPMKYLKANAKPLMYAAAPAIFAGANAQENMPKTTTGMIAPYSFDPYSGTYTAATPYRAAGGGLMDMDDGGYNPGQLDFTQRSEPVVRMADGGMPRYAGATDGSVVGATPPDYGAIVKQAYGNIGRSGIGTDVKNIDQAGYDFWTNALKTGAISTNDFNNRFGSAVNEYFTKTPDDKYADYVQNYAVNKFATPASTSADFLKSTKGLGLYDASLADALEESGYSKAAQYALTHAQDDKDFTSGIIDSKTGKPIEFYNTIGYKAGDLPGDEGGLKGYYANINYAVNGLQKLIDSGKMSVADAQNAYLSEMERVQGNLSDSQKATGRGFGELFKPKAIDKTVEKKTFTCPDGYTLNAEGTACIKDAVADIVKKDNTTDCPTGYHYDTATKSCVKNVDATQNTTAIVTRPTEIDKADARALPVGVSGAGITTINPNKTVTTRPDLNLPMKDVRDKYTQGGGSLGYTSPTFDSLKAVEDKYPLTGGSKQSYDYLTGKTKYSPVPYTETGEIMKPYSSSVLGIPTASAKQMYVFKNGKYEINPDYAIPTYDKDGKKSLALTNQDVINYVKSPEYSNDDTFVSWMTANNLTPEQIAAATGMPISEVYKKIKKAKPVEKVADTPVDGGGGGGGDANGGLMKLAGGGMSGQFNLGDYSDGGRLLRGPGDGVSDSIPASIGNKRPARLADGEFVVPARIVSELGNGSTEAGARKLYAMMDRVQSARRGTVGRGRVAKNSRADKHLPA